MSLVVRFSNGSIILVSKTVLLRRWECETNKLIKVELLPWKVWKLTHFQLLTPSSGEFRSDEGLTFETSDFQIFRSGDSTSIDSFGKIKFGKDCNKQDTIENSFNTRFICKLYNLQLIKRFDLEVDDRCKILQVCKYNLVKTLSSS